MLAGAFNVTKGMMLSDPAYEQYVKESGIDGNTDWHVNDMYSCGGPPCSAGWDFPTVAVVHIMPVVVTRYNVQTEIIF